MRRIIALAFLLAYVSPTFGQAMTREEIKAYDAEMARLQRCRFAPDSLIGLSATQLLAKCGRASRSNVTTTAAGRSMQLVFGFSGGVLMYVYTVDDIVTEVQSR